MTTYSTILCDRCGTGFQKDKDNPYRWEKAQFQSHGSYDLCPGCVASFERWMNALHRGNNVIRVSFK